LLRENVARGYVIPRERNPRRPIMTADRYEALLAVADQVTFEIVRCGERLQVRSYLPELLVLANETGRRLSAILGLRYEDVNLERRQNAPNGAVTWRAELHKKGVEWPDVPITPAARAAVEAVLRERPGIGKAERKAGLEHLPGGAWHPFRRKAATELKGAPDKDVMALLGWRDLQSLKEAYQHADPASMLVALEIPQVSCARRGEARELTHFLTHPTAAGFPLDVHLFVGLRDVMVGATGFEPATT
jgi:integrase